MEDEKLSFPFFGGGQYKTLTVPESQTKQMHPLVSKMSDAASNRKGPSKCIWLLLLRNHEHVLVLPSNRSFSSLPYPEIVEKC